MKSLFHNAVRVMGLPSIALTVAASSIATTASAEDILTNVTFAQEGGYSEFSNPEFIKCVATAIGDSHPNQNVIIDDQSRENGAESISIGVIYKDNWLLDDGMFLRVMSFNDNGHIDFLNLSHRNGEIIETIGDNRGSNKFQYRFFREAVIDSQNNMGGVLSSDFVKAMEDISHCTQSQITMADMALNTFSLGPVAAVSPDAILNLAPNKDL